MTAAANNPAFEDYWADEHRPVVDGRRMTDRELYAAAERDPEGPAALYLARSDRPFTWRELDALDEAHEAWMEHLCLCDVESDDDDGLGPWPGDDEMGDPHTTTEDDEDDLDEGDVDGGER